jgi:hypothetical protein
MASRQVAQFLSDAKSHKNSIIEVFKKHVNTANDVKSVVNQSVNELIVIIEKQNQIITKHSNNDSVNALCERFAAIENVNKQLCMEFKSIKSQLTNSNANTYAEAVRNNANNDKKLRPPVKNDNIVIIKSGNTSAKPEDSLTKIKKKLSETNCDINVQRVKYSSDGGLIINCETRKDSDLLIETVEKEVLGFTATHPKPKWPKIAIYGVSDEFNEDNIVLEVVKRNHDIKKFFEGNKKEGIDSHIICKFKFKREHKSGGHTWVLEISPKIHRIISNKRSICLGWHSYGYSDYIQITRCFKCCRFGHIARVCTEEHSFCGKCGENHETIKCNKKDKLFCINCHRHNESQKSQIKLSTNHSVFSEKCESLKRIKSIAISRTNYDI